MFDSTDLRADVTFAFSRRETRHTRLPPLRAAELHQHSSTLSTHSLGSNRVLPAFVPLCVAEYMEALKKS